MRRGWWAWVSAVLMIAVVLGVTAKVTLTWLSGGNGNNSGGAVCARHDAQTAVTIVVSVATDGLETPRITADLIVRLPISKVDHAALLGHQASADYRTALSCLLQDGMTDVSKVRHQWRDTDPVVSRDGEWLVVHDAVWADLWGHPSDDAYRADRVPVGLAMVEPVDRGVWLLSIRVPEALDLAQWQVTVHAPPGWLAAPAPLPTVIGVREMSWKDLRPGPQPLVAVALQLDTRTRVTADSNAVPGIWFSGPLAWLSGVLLAVGGLGILYRRRKDPLWRLAWPPLIILMAAMAEWTVRDAWAVSATRGTWFQYEWVLSLVALAVAAICAGLWRISWRVIGVAVLVAAVPPALVWWKRGWPWSPRWSHDRLTITDDVAWEASLANLGTVLIGSVLLLAGLLNAMRVLWQSWQEEAKLAGIPLKDEPPAKTVWPWLIAVGLASVLIVERLVLIVFRLQQWGWLDGGDWSVCCSVAWHGWAQVEEFAHGMLLVTAIVMGAMLFNELRGQAALSDGQTQVATALFLIAVAEVEVWAYGYWIPLWPLLWLVLLWWLRPGGGNSTVGGTPRLLAVVGLRAGWRMALVVAPLWVGLTWWLYPPVMVDRFESLIVALVVDVLWQVAVIAFGAGLLGLLWWQLPNRGLIKPLPLIVVYLIPLAAIDVVPRLTGGPADPLAYLKAAVFTLAMTATAWDIQYRHLTTPSGQRWWKQLFAREHAAERLSFMVTLLLCALAIAQFVSSGSVSEAPGSIEPPRLGR